MLRMGSGRGGVEVYMADGRKGGDEEKGGRRPANLWLQGEI
jgi:hypothetical protein